MVRLLIPLLVVGASACDRTAPSATEQDQPVATPSASKNDRPMPAPAEPVSDRAVLPTTMPPASGALAGRAFAVVKGILRFSGGRHTLDFWSSSVGGRCEHQLAPDPEQYLSLFGSGAPAPWTAGRAMTDDDLSVIYSGGDPLAHRKKQVTLVLDEIDEARQLARGRLDVRVDDGTAYSGAFEVAYCSDGVVARETGGEIAGVRWGDSVEPAKIPDAPVAAELGGREAAIVHAAAGRVPGVADAPLFVDLFTAKPPDACALHVGAGVATPGFAFGLGVAPKSGQVLRHQGTSERDAAGPTYALATVRMREDDPLQTSGDGDMLVVVDRIDSKRVVGRVYAAFRDRGKSLVVGRFDAPICSESDIR
jgi:hypothetical protein